jgi:glucokinase
MEGEDPAAVISRHGLAADDRLCERALSLFVRCYGAAAGDVALTVGARGGVYVAGGIAPKLLPALRDGRFMDAFRDKGRMRAYMQAIPVRVILYEDVGLLGAAAAASHGGEDVSGKEGASPRSAG